MPMRRLDCPSPAVLVPVPFLSAAPGRSIPSCREVFLHFSAMMLSSSFAPMGVNKGTQVERADSTES